MVFLETTGKWSIVIEIPWVNSTPNFDATLSLQNNKVIFIIALLNLDGGRIIDLTIIFMYYMSYW